MRPQSTPKLPNTTCTICQREFYVSKTDRARGKGIYCSRPCYYAAKAANSTQETRTCQHCGTEFRVFQSELRKGYGQYCSAACRDLDVAKRRRAETEARLVHKTCPVCQKEFAVRKATLRKGEGKFCSSACGQRGKGKLQKDPANWRDCTCERCGKEFQIPRSARPEEGRFCSRACREEPVGTRIVEKRGYVYVKQEDGTWKHEHRLVMEQVLGRPLGDDFVVHHIDSQKHNNAPSNLQVLGNQEHLALHGEMRRRDTWSPTDRCCRVCFTSERPHKAFGLCERCYRRQRKGVDPNYYRS